MQAVAASKAVLYCDVVETIPSTVELLIWNTIGTGPEAIPYDGYSTADEINKKLFCFETYSTTV
jgi:hypothetical protein